MANVFAITTVTDNLIAESGSTTTVFTVTNITTRPLRGIAKTKPLGNTKTEWIKGEGETERDFPPGGTHQFTVSFVKPLASASETRPAESYQFRFDVISSANPDEDFTEGPVVTINIPENKGAEKKPFRWWLIAIPALVLLVAGVAAWLVLREAKTEIEVPDVTANKTFEEAEADLKKAGLKAERVEEVLPATPADALNKVAKQDPPPGTKIGPDSPVKLTFAATSSVPELRSKTLGDALKLLKNKELVIGTVTGDADAIKNGTLNTITSQNPLAGQLAAKGSGVSVSFPCGNNLPFNKRCLQIDDITDIRIDPEIKRQIDLNRLSIPKP